ncbi:hypothetical protein [Porphyromonas gulae]|uniref:CRISPR-associated protein Cmr1 n=1 Tax=Porphyromonas gulae TaxID=111105 RepID=A0A0A2FWV3_9PORP|nr:hypothetical protein [Porphyromonas gulae]KGN94595.1 hypothetical protein HR15_00785 [Porphyromonas gulae]KKC50748.1 hypothetical protein HR10_07885 [Porphyromonas gulae]
MEILTFELIQHTPIIHFQAGDMGATLRASEVKPKLDRYLCKNFPHRTKGHETDLMGDKTNTKLSLNYKMSFRAKNIKTWNIEKNNAPMFFGNLSNDPENRDKKALSVASGGVTMTIIINEESQKEFFTKKCIANFFLLHNFGTRQSKGYGSFTLREDSEDCIWERANKIYEDLAFKIRIGIYADKLRSINFQGSKTREIIAFYKVIFKGIEYLYRSLRSGINEYRKNKNSDYKTEDENIFYMKPAIYCYAKHLGCNWDKFYIKRKIAQKIPNIKYSNQDKKKIEKLKRDKTNANEENDTSTPYYDFRDMLGFSTVETWNYYNKIKIQKEYTTLHNGKIEKINRMKSPIQFKPIFLRNNDNSGYELWVFIGIFEEEVGLTGLLNSKAQVKVTAKKGLLGNGKATENFIFHEKISIKNFLDTVFSQEDFFPHMDEKDTEEGEEIKEFLSDIYIQLKDLY